MDPWGDRNTHLTRKSSEARSRGRERTLMMKDPNALGLPASSFIFALGFMANPGVFICVVIQTSSYKQNTTLTATQ